MTTKSCSKSAFLDFGVLEVVALAHFIRIKIGIKRKVFFPTSCHLPSSCCATMPHTPLVPSPIICPDASCGQTFYHPRDFKVHSHVHNSEREDKMLHCPKSGCSFKVLQLKRLEAHVDFAHHEQPRQFQCLEDRCPFSTTTQGALTRHYRERHHIEPPTTGRKPAPTRRRPPQKTYDVQNQSTVASTSRVPERLASSSATSVLSTALAPEVVKHYPSAAYYPTSSPRAHAASPPSNNVPVYLNSLHAKLPQPCPPTGPHSAQCVRPPTYTSPRLSPMAIQSDYGSAGDPPLEWVSWRDECDDIASDVIAIATGERPLCERSMLTPRTEYLPVPADIGMTDRRFLWA
ncbi:hypothetical protein MVEN_00213200 [Mycena venus]|uniref:C2H2-type domain-containing protein n=1 Tax=Mycena venus TaxID=2733690 RepID=A0A8H7DB09_9AGAR|nr:hypothetical protein MVEN_00213200 [Mycena venus]